MESPLKNGTHMSLYNDGEVRQYLTDRYAAELQARGLRPDQISDDVDLLNEGIIDSMGSMELVAFVESAFGIKVEMSEVVVKNFDSVRQLANFVRRKLGVTADKASLPLERAPTDPLPMAQQGSLRADG